MLKRSTVIRMDVCDRGLAVGSKKTVQLVTIRVFIAAVRLLPALLPTGTWRSCWPRAASPLTTSPSTGGCSGSPRSSSWQPGRAAMRLGTSGSWTRPTSRLSGDGLIFTGQSISMARSSTSFCRYGATWPPPAASSPGRCALARFRSRSRRTARPLTRGCSMSWFLRPCRGTCLRPEPVPRPLRHHHRDPRHSPAPHRLR
jgi:hypothetical protein